MNKINKHLNLFLVGVLLLCISCNQTTQNELLPVLTTAEVTAISQTSASCGGSISSDGGSVILFRGVCWSIKANPTIADNKTTDSSGIGNFTSNITGLNPNTTYFIRAFANTASGTAYGNSIQITTLAASPTITDIDGNTYKTVTIGTQVWMAENLKVTKYRDGSSIPNVTGISSWASTSIGAWCDYSNSTTNGSIYGHLYNWYAAVDTRNIAPIGWHIPTDIEWKTLENYLIANGFNYDKSTTGNKIGKSLASKDYWLTDTSVGSVANDVSKNNSTGFNALPSGWRYDGNGSSYGLGWGAIWWSSTNLYNMSISADKNMSSGYVDSNAFNGYKHFGFAIRCVKD